LYESFLRLEEFLVELLEVCHAENLRYSVSRSAAFAKVFQVLRTMPLHSSLMHAVDKEYASY
jgi:hypothetical protein